MTDEHNLIVSPDGTCKRCKGYGKLQRVAPSGLERYTPYGFEKPFDCPDCNGTGQHKE